MGSSVCNDLIHIVSYSQNFQKIKLILLDNAIDRLLNFMGAYRTVFDASEYIPSRSFSALLYMICIRPCLSPETGKSDRGCCTALGAAPFSIQFCVI